MLGIDPFRGYESVLRRCSELVCHDFLLGLSKRQIATEICKLFLHFLLFLTLEFTSVFAIKALFIFKSGFNPRRGRLNVFSALFQQPRPKQMEATMDKEKIVRNQTSQRILRIAIIQNNDRQHLQLVTYAFTLRFQFVLGLADLARKLINTCFKRS